MPKRGSVLIALLMSGTAVADPTPTSLRMRAPRGASTPRPVRRPQLAQGDIPDPAAPAAADAPPTAADAPPVPPVPDAPPQDNVTETPNLSDEELARLAEAEATQGETIEITGSTIERRELTTPAPVTVLDQADLDAAGLATIGDILQNLPAQSNAINAQVNNGGDGSTRVDLRGLGTARTLVLLNGRRVVPGGLGADASVDLNAIPLAVIERVEVLKDGASAVYGSDAIGGVVNIITRDDFQGTEATLYTGNSQRNDGFTYDMSFVTGHTSPKGNLIFSAGWQRQSPVFAGDRAFSEFDKDYDFESGEEFNGGSSATLNGRINPTTIDYDGDGVPDDIMGIPNTSCTGAACQPDGMGGWRPFVAPDDLYNYQPENYLYTPSQRYNAFAKGHYNVGNHAKVFFEGLYLNRKSDQRLAPEPFLAAVPISRDSIYNPLGGDVYDYRRRLAEFGPRQSLQNIDTFRVVAGISGKVPETAPALRNWKWEVSYNYGRTTGVQRGEGNLILSRLANALGPSFVDASGVPRCGTPGNVIPGCVPMNIMGPFGSIEKAARDYVTFTGVNTGFNDQKTALAQASGIVTELPNNGDISLAVGANYRREAGGFTPDPLTSTGDTTGNAQAPTGGTYDVLEAYTELSIVPLAAQKHLEWLELNVAARGYRFNTFGSGLTWKAGGLAKAPWGLGLRGTYSTSFRAPSVAELYQGRADSFPTASDPCDTDLDGDGVSDGPIANATTSRRCQLQGVPDDAVFGTIQQRSIVGGNSSLDAETAKTLTAGVVYEPRQVKGLSVTLDYFKIQIDNAIQSIGAQAILANCYINDSDEACARITRDPQLGYAIDFIDDPISNVGGTNTSGLDFAIAYEHKTASAGRFRHQFEGQYLLEYDLASGLLDAYGNDVFLKGLGYYDLGVYPRFRTNFSSMWQKKGVSAGLNVRYIGGYKECVDNSCNTLTDEDFATFSRDVDVNITGDLYGGYTTKSPYGTTTFTVGVNNVTDQRPPLIYIGFAGDSDAATYDYMGRYFYARVAQLF